MKKLFLLTIALIIFSVSFGQLTSKKESIKINEISLYKDNPILSYRPVEVNLYLEKPKRTGRGHENDELKAITLVGGVVFGAILTLNYIGEEYENPKPYWYMMGGLVIICTTIQITF